MPFGGGALRHPSCGRLPPTGTDCLPTGEGLHMWQNRDGRFEIHTCPIEGGSERKLTRGFDHCDGPDYTPGRNMDLVQWRNRQLRAALANATRRNRSGTNDRRRACELVSAPVSGRKARPVHRVQKWGSRASRNHDVELRLMPASGGKPEVLVSLLGGQGTINVPCWSPTSQQFAFVQYRAAR